MPLPPLTSTRIVREIAAMYDEVLVGVLVKVDYVRAPRPVVSVFSKGSGICCSRVRREPVLSTRIHAGPAGAGMKRLSGWLSFLALEIACNEA